MSVVLSQCCALDTEASAAVAIVQQYVLFIVACITWWNLRHAFVAVPPRASPAKRAHATASIDLVGLRIMLSSAKSFEGDRYNFTMSNDSFRCPTSFPLMQPLCNSPFSDDGSYDVVQYVRGKGVVDG